MRSFTGKQSVVKGFFEKRTSSVQYVVFDPATKKCVIIDPVLDFEEKSGTTATRSAEAILSYVKEQRLTIELILDTHAHADHLSASWYLKQKTHAPIAIGDGVCEVQKVWKQIYNWPDLPTDGSQWDRLIANGEKFWIGEIEVEAILSPGHTPASMTYVMGDAVFVHDTLFAPDYGTARADFPGGNAAQLWRSIQRILALPEEFRVFTGHDYQPGGRAVSFESTIAEQRNNTHLVRTGNEAAFVAFRESRDKTLPLPKLLLPSLQVNIRGGRLPEPESNGRRYLKIPLDAFEGAVWDE